ncbi:MAG: mechanosensitive ion channel family protein [Erysipelotrichaceae bacterium]|nr:mechanosensitive ion channel family protein [Erysipelotrichaceae bacterium]
MQATIDYLMKQLQILLPYLLRAGTIVVIGYIVYRIISHILAKMARNAGVDEIILNFIHNVTRIVATVIIILMAGASLGVDLTSVVAMFTVVSAAIALAVKDSIASMIDGVKIMFAKPFNKGDLIEVNGVKGTIEEISLFYTFLMTKDNKKVVIPNSTIANTVLVNYSSESYRRAEMIIDVAYASDIDHVKEAVYGILNDNPLCAPHIEPMVILTEYKASAISFTARAWVETDNFETSRSLLLQQIKEALDKEGITIPFPQMDIKIKN